MISGNPRAISAAANNVRSVSSRLAPSGRSTTTAISDLLSNGSNLTVTALVANSVIDNSVADADTEQEYPGRALAAHDRGGKAAVDAPEHAFAHARREPQPRRPVSGASRSISQGATTMATKNENSIAADALAGIGAM